MWRSVEMIGCLAANWLVGSGLRVPGLPTPTLLYLTPGQEVRGQGSGGQGVRGEHMVTDATYRPQPPHTRWNSRSTPGTPRLAPPTCRTNHSSPAQLPINEQTGSVLTVGPPTCLRLCCRCRPWRWAWGRGFLQSGCSVGRGAEEQRGGVRRRATAHWWKPLSLNSVILNQPWRLRRGRGRHRQRNAGSCSLCN